MSLPADELISLGDWPAAQRWGGEPGASTSRPILAAARTFVENRLAVVGGALLVLLVLFCFIGPLLYRTNQIATNLAIAELPPSAAHPLGTDEVGYDVLGRLMAGGQTSLIIGLASAMLATVAGTVVGAVAGYSGGVVDALLMRIVDGLLAVPALLLVIVLATMFTPSTVLLILVIASLSWLSTARLVRAETLSLREREFVQAVKLAGGRGRRAVVRHIIPNTIGTVIVSGTFQVATAILLLAALDFLGLGIPPPAASWGQMLSTGVNYVYDGYWWLIVPAGLAILLTVLAFNFIGDGLRDAVEARLRTR
jgi:peptide/nickel transport system permease protein